MTVQMSCWKLVRQHFNAHADWCDCLVIESGLRVWWECAACARASDPGAGSCCRRRRRHLCESWIMCAVWARVARARRTHFHRLYMLTAVSTFQFHACRFSVKHPLLLPICTRQAAHRYVAWRRTGIQNYDAYLRKKSNSKSRSTPHSQHMFWHGMWWCIFRSWGDVFCVCARFMRACFRRSLVSFHLIVVREAKLNTHLLHTFSITKQQFKLTIYF